jgi:predicted secreted acid phosphatase
MKKYLLILLILLTVSGCSSTKIINLTDAKNRVVDYYETEKYYNDLNSVLEEINSHFKFYDVKHNDAVVFDVDETTLSNYDYIKSIDFGYEHKLWSDWQDKGIAKAILPVKNLYNILIEKDIKVIFITGRSTKNYEATYKNLIAEGYTKFDTLICRKPLDSFPSMADFKYAMRKQMSANGYNIIANIGDQETDFSGGYNGKIVKLPNYIYKID